MTATPVQTIPTLDRRPTHKVLPLLASEVSRITHRRLFRVLSLVFLAAIIVISTIAFFAHGNDEAVNPRHGHLYKAYELLPAVVIAISIAAAGVAFIVGASSGGAEWSSRSMTLQLLFEPRRLRLLTVKWLGLLLSTTAVTAVAMAVGMALGAFTASARGTWDSRYALDGLSDGLWSNLTVMGLRGLLLTAFAATIGYAIAMLVRNTGASLGVAFVYFVVLENGVRLALLKYGTEPFMLSTTSVASLFPGGLDVPGRENSFGEFTEVHVSNLRANLTMLLYTALIAIPAAVSFTKRDVA